MIRVLHIFYEMSNGGIEHFVMNYYRHIDRSKIQFDFLVSVDGKGYFDDEITQLGGKIFHAYPLKKNPIKNYFSIAKIVKTYNYKIVHRHTGSAFGYFDLRAAKFGGAKKLILHSHNNQAGNKLLHYLSNIFLKIPCEKLACSKDAGKWLFGNDDFIVINNAIDTSKFQFDLNIREKMRSELNISDNFVIGHIGRFEDQKNHEKLFDIFNEISKENDKTVLICVGSGNKLNACKSIIRNLNLENKVIFLENRSDVNLIMNVFDVFVLPSKYEGFPFVLIEAQANGLHCIVSDRVPDECNITNNVFFVELNNSNHEWKKYIFKTYSTNRTEFANKVKSLGYDLNSNAKYLCDYYYNLN